jgi:cytoskeletal protein RodZ
MFEDNDPNTFEEEEQPAEESSNRNFFIIAGILIGIVCLSVVGLGYYAMRVLPQQSNQRNAQEATLMAQEVQGFQTLTALAQSDMLSRTPLPSATLPPTNTPPVAQASATTTPAPETVAAASTSDPQTATVAAALTQAAQAQLTVTFLPTSTALPTSGFADEAGLPGLVAMTIALVVVILLARRLRASPTAR